MQSSISSPSNGRNPNSIYSCLATARENARTVREQISVEMWEQINRMYLFFLPGDAKRLFHSSTYEFFKWTLEASQLFQGICEATMAHDEGWEFIQLGIFLERADRTSRILDIKYHILLPSGEQVGGNVDTVQWMAVLKSCSALEPYRKHYRGQVKPWKVVEFLVKNQTFPRSILFCVDSVDHSLHKITGVDRGDFQYNVEAERLSGKLLADLCYRHHRRSLPARTARIPGQNPASPDRDQQSDLQRILRVARGGPRDGKISGSDHGNSRSKELVEVSGVRIQERTPARLLNAALRWRCIGRPICADCSHALVCIRTGKALCFPA